MPRQGSETFFIPGFILGLGYLTQAEPPRRGRHFEPIRHVRPDAVGTEMT